MNEHSDHVSSTIGYYDDNADAFIGRTVNVDMSELYDRFLPSLPDGGRILDFGCGSGRDSKVFKDRGYAVTPIDGSSAMVEATRLHTGLEARQLKFQDLDYDAEFDGVWACATLLHVPMTDMRDVVSKMIQSLKPNGLCMISVKVGEGESSSGDRHWTFFNEVSLSEFLGGFDKITLGDVWISKDRRSRDGLRWVNALFTRH